MDSSIRNCRFFSTHNSCVRSVSFNPKDRYLFCSGGNDGQIGIYHAGRAELLSTYSVISSGLNRYVSAVSFSSDGKKILATTSSRRVSVIDVQHGTPIVCYDNCAYSSSRDRTPLAVDPECPNIAACSYVNGKGVTILDLRMPLPLDFIFDFHSDIIRDITFLHESWPFSTKSSSLSSSSSSLLENETSSSHHHKSGCGGGYTLLSLSSQGQAKVTSMDGRLLHTFDFGHPGNSIVPTPEHYGSTHDGFTSAWLCGGNIISSYVPNEETLKLQQQNSLSQTTHHEQRISSMPSQIHFNPTYNPNVGGNQNPSGSSSGDHESNRNNGSNNQSSSLSWNHQFSSSSSFNVIISNPNNVNLNVYQIPRRNDLIFGQIGSVDSIRIQRTIRSIVASSHQQVNSSSNNQQQPLQSSSSSEAATAALSAVNENSNSSISNSRLLRNFIHQNQHLPYQQIILDDSRSSSTHNLPSNNHNFIQDNCDDDDDDEDDDDDDDDDDCNNPIGFGSSGHGNFLLQQTTSNQKIDLHTPLNSFVKKTLFYHDHWDHSNITSNSGPFGLSSDHNNHNNMNPQQIYRLRFSSNGAHLYAAGEGGFVRSYRRCPNLTMHCLGEVYRHHGDILDMDISPYDEFLVTASKDKTVGFICLGTPSHGWTEYYEYT